MDFPAVMDRLELHAKASGAALRNKITDVAIGPPTPKGSRSVRLFYGGEVDPSDRMGGRRVLDGDMVGERIVILGFWSLTNASDDQVATVMLEMRQLKHELKTRILGDSKLNGDITDLALGFAEPDFTVIGNGPVAVLTLECIAYLEEYTIVTVGPA